MNDSKLTIAVSGTTNSGKSTVALAIAQLLRGYGLLPDLKDEDGEYRRPSWRAHNDERMAALVERKAEIEISTRHERRTAVTEVAAKCNATVGPLPGDPLVYKCNRQIPHTNLHSDTGPNGEVFAFWCTCKECSDYEEDL